MNQEERQSYFIQQEEAILKGGAAFSEWCTFISKSVYDAFINKADLATIITATACIETYFKTESPESRGKSLAYLIDKADFLTDTEKSQLHQLRKYRNSWVHVDRIDDTPILENESIYLDEVENMAILSVRLMLIVLFSNQFA